MKAKHIQFILIFVLGIAIFSFFQFNYQYHFYYQEQEQLFLMDWEYVKNYLSFSQWGGFARLVGDFLTQFYYYMYVGAAILTLMLLIVGDLARRAAESAIAFFVEKENAVTSWIAFSVGVAAMCICLLMSFDHTFKLGNLVSIAGLCLFVWIAFKAFRHFDTRIAKLICFAVCLPFYYLFIPQRGEFNAKIAGPDYMFERVLAFDNEYYFGHYDKVIEMGRANEGNLTEEESFFYCLALEKKGLLADELPKMKAPNLGTFIQVGPETPRFTIRMMDELYYLLGDMTYAERAALLANTFSKYGRSARKIKRLAECNLVNGDMPAATKYLRLLEKTLVYKDWAKKQMEAVQPEIAEKQQFINTSDNIRIGDDCYTILTQLLESNRKNTVALDYLLLSDMLAHQREVFVRDYEMFGPSENATLSSIYNSAKQ